MKEPGWDAKAISEIAKKAFGGFRQMFKHHGWPEQGRAMMPNAGKRVKETYGSVKSFVAHWNGRKAGDN